MEGEKNKNRKECKEEVLKKTIIRVKGVGKVRNITVCHSPVHVPP